MEDDSTPTIRDLYPHFTDEELAEAEDTLERYVAAILSVFDQIEGDMDPKLDALASGEDLVSCTTKRTGQSANEISKQP